MLSAAGCQLFKQKPNSGTAEEVKAILTEVKFAVGEVNKKQAELIAAERARQDAVQNKDQFISNHVNAASVVNEQNPQANEHTDIVGRELAPTLPLLPPPTLESQAQALRNLSLALDKSEASRRELELNYEIEKRKSAELKGQVDATVAVVTKKEEELQSAAIKLDTTVQTLADKEAEVRIQAAEAERQAVIARAEAASKTRLKVAYCFMGLGGLIAVGAVVATVLRVPGVLHAGLTGGGSLMLIGWIITYIEDLLQHLWFQVTVGIVLLIVLGVVAMISLRAVKTRRKAIVDEKISTGAIGAIQELKNDDKKMGNSHYAPLKAKLEEWYVDDDGKPDTALSGEITNRLVDMNLVNPVSKTN